MILSNLPGLSKAGSTMSILFVAPMINTSCNSSKPSISVRICDTTFSAACEVSPPIRLGMIASISSKNMIHGAANRIDIVDPALLRPGRFDRIIEVPKPDSKAREHIFKIHTKKKPLSTDIDFKKLVELTKGFSGAEIASAANRAAITALKRFVSGKHQTIKEIKITQQDLVDAIGKTKPFLTREEQPLTQTIK